MDSLLSALSENADDETLQETLSQIKRHLIQSSEASMRVLHSREFFNLLVVNYETSYDILELCFSNLKLTNDEPDLTEIIEKVVRHPNQRVAVVATRFVERNVQTCPPLQTLSTLQLFIECMKSAEASIGVPSIRISSDLLQMNNFLDNSGVKQQLMNLAQESDDTVKLRVFSVAVIVSIKSEILMDKISFLLDKCVADLESSASDVLVTMNLIEILKDLCTTQHGLNYLENKGVFDRLMKRLETIDDDPYGSILAPGLTKFFGVVASAFPDKIFRSYPALIQMLFKCILHEDVQLMFTALDTLGFLGRFDEGKRNLDNFEGDECLKVLEHIAASVSRYPSELKSRALSCLENVFFVDVELPRNNQIEYICQKWFMGAFKTGLSTILEFCKNPFDDISMGGFKLLRSFCLHECGQKGVARTGGFVEFLLDRNMKISLELKQIKYEIIKLLAESNHFDAAILLQLQRYVREGFNYVQGVTEIAFESN